jgi:hypothetical protein
VTRDPIQPVTNGTTFALLVHAVPPQAATGVATFFAELGVPVPVHLVALEELKKTARELRGLHAKEFDALLALRGAVEAKDELALADAKERLEQVYRLREAEDASRRPLQDAESRRKFAEQVASRLIGLPPEESQKHYEGLRPGPRAMEDPLWLLSQEVSRTIDVWASLALWSVQEKLMPAIFCFGPNQDFAMRIALYVHTFQIAPTGEVGIRLCPYCKDQFWQDKSNKGYCCPGHRENHRMARSRFRRKNGIAGKRIEGGKDGTQKTR